MSSSFKSFETVGNENYLHVTSQTNVHLCET